MCNVRINPLIIVLTALTLLVSCGKKERTKLALPASHQLTSGQMVRLIDELLDKGDYKQAIVMIDSLNATYSQDAAARKTTLLSRARAMEGLYRDSIPKMDAIMTWTQMEMDSLKQFFTTANGYIVDKEASGQSGSNTAVARLESEKKPWTLTVTVEGKPGITGLTLHTNSQSVSISAKDAQSRRSQSGSKETMTFRYKEVNPIGEALSGTPSGDATLTVEGTSGDIAINLPPSLQQAIWRIYRYSYLNQLNMLAKVNRDTYERKLAVAQNQVANFQNPSVDTPEDTLIEN